MPDQQKTSSCGSVSPSQFLYVPRSFGQFPLQYRVLDSPAVEYRTAVFVPLLLIHVPHLNAESIERRGGFVFLNSVAIGTSVSSSVGCELFHSVWIPEASFAIACMCNHITYHFHGCEISVTGVGATAKLYSAYIVAQRCGSVLRGWSERPIFLIRSRHGQKIAVLARHIRYW